ncbi:uncharacterized protein PV09_03693 [Verruconis gallopava]|uniref:RlpA-like protein double-psi beta-barrel domain-containing protein n=1 Tax=Verruconis gallopava TaxID=253628 RepID=A0A0D1YWQ9_9PEZI|nr:uncharacterized protein PV09_03693 [Verruconis gallopava]KIW05142.1 hypothetical protein PV09_03693 [Verruconis gallopava]
MKSFAIFALSATALAAPAYHKRDYVYDTVIESVYETVYTTTTLWVDPTQTPVSSAAAFYEQPQAAPTSSSAAPAVAVNTPAAAAAAQVQPEQASQVTTSAVYVAPTEAPAQTSTTSAAAVVSQQTYVPQAPATTTTASTQTGTSSGGGAMHTGDMTYYDVSVGTGSCGTTASNSEFVVALSHLDMNNGVNPNANPLCGQKINIYYNGATHQATIFDTCPTCAEGSIDVTQSLFEAVAPNGDGRVHDVTWSLA